MPSFGAGGKSSSAWNSAMKCTWLPRSRMLTPFLVAITGIAVEVGRALLELGEVLDAS